MARIAGVNIPNHQHAEIALQAILLDPNGTGIALTKLDGTAKGGIVAATRSAARTLPRNSRRMAMTSFNHFGTADI